MPDVAEFTMEHVGLNVPDAEAAASWHVAHLAMKVLRTGGNKAHFLADASGRVVLELYTNPQAPVPDYAAQDPLVLHVAYFTGDVGSARDKLVAAGATLHADFTRTDGGDEMAMLRDPWGIPIQLMKRAEAML